MLVLSRKMQQQIKIGDQITVTILAVKGNTVRLGVEAPQEVRVLRGELPKKVEGETEAASPAEPATAPVQTASASEASDDVEKPVAPLLPLIRLRQRRMGSGPIKRAVACSVSLAAAISAAHE